MTTREGVAPVAPLWHPVDFVFSQLSGGMAPLAPPRAKPRNLRGLCEVALFTLTANYKGRCVRP